MDESEKTPEGSAQSRSWPRFDKAAFGLIYGAFLVLSILMTSSGDGGSPFRTAAVLFGSVLAISLAKAFGEFLGNALDCGRHLTRSAWRATLQHSSPTLAAANLPTLLFVAAGAGWMPTELATSLSQAVCVAILMAIGGRLGWVIDRRIGMVVLGSFFAGGVNRRRVATLRKTALISAKRARA